MSLITLENGIWWPDIAHPYSGGGGVAPTSAGMTIDATDEKAAFLGRVKIAGNASSKTFSSAGAKIHFLTAAVTFATAGSTVRIGLQGFSTTSGPPKQPDGTWSTYKDMVQGTDTFTANAWNSITMGAGTATLSTGDQIAVVFDFTTRNGSDSLAVNAATDLRQNSQGVAQYTTAWALVAGLPVVMLEFDDGTFATIDGSFPYSSFSSGIGTYTDSSNPDEYGLLFQVPFRCAIDGARWLTYVAAAAASDATLTLYADPLGTPTSLASVNIYGEQADNFNGLARTLEVFSSVVLSPNTDYCLALKATSTGSVSLRMATIADAAYRAVFNGGTHIRAGSRNGSSGAFSETTTNIPLVDVRINKIDDGTGGGRASFSIGI